MSLSRLNKVYFLLFVLLSIGGCAFPPFYEPYPAMEYKEIRVEDTPAYILDRFQAAYPTARILIIEEESFQGHLRGYLITYAINDVADTILITTEGEIVSE